MGAPEAAEGLGLVVPVVPSYELSLLMMAFSAPSTYFVAAESI
ncbi:MAG TPA: hypothetical protein VGF11_02445 [Acidimicrobiales bacterium]